MPGRRYNTISHGFPDYLLMKNLPKLTGEIITAEGPSPVTGADFWLSGANGAASQFSGDAGRKRLSVHIRTLLPSPAEGLNF